MSDLDLVAAAEREIAEADELVVTLEDAVRNGDASVTVEQIEKARAMGHFARLRRVAAERQAEKDAEAAKAAEFEALLAEHLPGSASVDGPIDELLDKAAEFIEQAIQIAVEHDSHVAAIALHATTEGNRWRPDLNPDLVGSTKLGEYAWFETRGQRGEIIGAAGVIARVVRRFKDDVQWTHRYDGLRQVL